MFTSKTERIK